MEAGAIVIAIVAGAVAGGRGAVREADTADMVVATEEAVADAEEGKRSFQLSVIRSQ